MEVVPALAFDVRLSPALPFGFEAKTLAEGQRIRDRQVESANRGTAIRTRGSFIQLCVRRLSDWCAATAALNLN